MVVSPLGHGQATNNIRCDTPPNLIPVLIRCSPNKREGYATFNTLRADQAVRAFGDEDLERTPYILRALREHEREHWYALLDLMQAMEHKKRRGLRKALRRLGAAAKGERGQARRPWQGNQADLEFGRSLTRVLGLRPNQAKEALDIFEGYKPPRGAESDLRHRLSYEVSRALLNHVRLVLWWNGERFLPAFFCEDHKAAIYVWFLLKFFTTDGAIRICPQCGNPFIQQGRADKGFCSTTHRDAHRQARWRARKKRKQRRRPLARATA